MRVHLNLYKESQLLSRKLLFMTSGRSSDSLLWAGPPSRKLVFSGMMAGTMSLQQRELSGICTRFPIEPCGTAYRRQRYIFFMVYILTTRKSC